MDAPAGDSHEQGAMSSPTRQPLPIGSGPFTLRSLLEDVPLVTDETGDDVKITCVDYLGAPPARPSPPAARGPRLTPSRSQPIRRDVRGRAPPLRPDPRRSRRQIRPRPVHPRVPPAPRLLRVFQRSTWPSTGCPKDPTAARGGEGLRSLQLDRHLLLSPRARPRLREHPSQEL